MNNHDTVRGQILFLILLWDSQRVTFTRDDALPLQIEEPIGVELHLQIFLFLGVNFVHKLILKHVVFVLNLVVDLLV